MALKITQLTTNSVTGTLDGVLPVDVSRDGETIVAQIGSWSHRLMRRLPDSAAEMRTIAYEILARFRETQRKA